MKCPFCNSEVTLDDQRCPKCGYNLEHLRKKENTNCTNDENIAIMDDTKPIKFLISIGIYYLIMYIGAIFIQTILVALIDISTPEGYNLALLLSQILVYAVLCGTLVPFLFKSIKIDTLLLKGKIKKTLLTVLIGVAILYGINILINIFFSIIKFTDNAANQEAIESMFTNNSGILIFIYCIVIAIIGPLVEELIFRKAIFGCLKKFPKLNKIWKIVISGLIFGLIHVISGIVEGAIAGDTSLIISEAINSITYVSMGFLFGGIYVYSEENIYPSLIVHIINNTISIVIILMIK